MKNYIEDILSQLIAEAFEIKNNASNDFESGKLMGYYLIISKILNQAEAFGVAIDLSPNLREFNPESLFEQ